MPPKNKGTRKKSAKARKPTLICGLTREEISREQLEEHIVRLRVQLHEQKEEIKYYQLERDKFNTLKEITDRQIEEVKAECETLEKDMEEDERRHRVKIKEYKQKMKHLLCEHQNTLSELKADGLVSTEVVQKERLETELYKEKKDSMQEVDNEKLIKELEVKHDEEMTKTRNKWEKQLTEIQADYEKKMELVTQELDNMRINVTSKREDDWRSHINALIDDHNKAFSEATALIDSIQQDEDMAVSLRKQNEDMKTKMNKKKMALVSLLEDNKHLVERLSKIKEEIAENLKKTKYYAAKKNFDHKVRKQRQKELKELKLECKELDQKISKVQLDRDKLHKTFTENIQKVQHKADSNIMLLEKKLKDLTDNVKKTQAQFSSVLSASNVDQSALGGVINKMEEYLDSRNNSIKNLQFRKAQISKAHKDLLLTYEALGVPV